MKPNNIVLEAVTGSKAYGLDTPDSDDDIRGIYVVPTNQLLGIFEPKLTYDHTEPDWCYHEIGKFIKLALKANPTIIEMLYLNEYRTLTSIGRKLVKNRELFLSNTVYYSYGGYALSQARSLNKNGHYGGGRSNRFEKHSRHCLRLLYQGRELLETGKLTVKVSEEMRQELFEFGKLSVDEVINIFEQKFKEFDKIKSVLPKVPNFEKINEFLIDVRKEYYVN